MEKSDSAGNIIVQGNCIKCKQRPHTINVRYAVYCQECFLEQTFHKFRLAVAKSKSSPSPERILIAFSGGISSRLLLHLSQLPKLNDPDRKNLDNFEVVHIQSPNEATKPNLQNPYQIVIETIPLEDVLFDGNQDRYFALLNSFSSSSSKMELSRILIQTALVVLACERSIKKVYLGDNCTRLAIDIISDTCHGRGEILPWRTSILQHFNFKGQQEVVTFVRPLRDIVELEVNYYSKVKGEELDFLSSNEKVLLPSPNNDNDTEESVYKLTERFIKGLDAENSATVSTVTRTSSKIQTSSTMNNNDNQRPCALCLCPLSVSSNSSPFCYGCNEIINDTEGLDHSNLPSYTLDIMKNH